MRDFIATMARQRSNRSILGLLWQRVRNWRMRRDLSVLERLDDVQLRDIGLKREDLQRLRHLPLSVDPQWELDRLRLLATRR